MLAAAKHQVLEKMGEAGLSRLLIFRSDVIPGVNGYDRRLVVLMDDHGQPVVEHEALIGNIDFFRRVFHFCLTSVCAPPLTDTSAIANKIINNSIRISGPPQDLRRKMLLARLGTLMSINLDFEKKNSLHPTFGGSRYLGRSSVPASSSGCYPQVSSKSDQTAEFQLLSCSIPKCQTPRFPIPRFPVQALPKSPASQLRPNRRLSHSKIFSLNTSRAIPAKRSQALTREGTVVSLTADSVILDIGFKTEGVLPLTAFPARQAAEAGRQSTGHNKGRDPEGYYELTRGKVERPTDWASLEKAFAEKSTIVGTVTGVIKGGLSVDIGVRAFMPASRSGTKDAAELAKLVEQEIRCRIIKLDIDEEDVVVDRRAVAEDEERAGKERRFSELKEGDTVQGEVRSLTDYGAFVDIGGADALLHVGEISWRRVNKPSDVLSTGQQIEAASSRSIAEKNRIAISMKQLQPHPWDAVAGKYTPGERVRGAITRLTDLERSSKSNPALKA